MSPAERNRDRVTQPVKPVCYWDMKADGALCPLNIPGAGRAKWGAADMVARMVPLAGVPRIWPWDTPGSNREGGGDSWLRGVSLGTSIQISSIVVISIIRGFACVIPVNRGLILLKGGSRILWPGGRGRADNATKQMGHGWVWGGDTGVTKPPRSPGCHDTTDQPFGHRRLWQTAFLPASSRGRPSSGSEPPTATAGPHGDTAATAPAAAAGHRFC